MQRAEEDALVLAAQAGGKRAFEKLIRHYHRPLVRFAYSLCNDRELAQDAVQNAWLRAGKRLTRLTDPRGFRSWIYQAVRWETIDLVRAVGRRNTVSTDMDSMIQPEIGKGRRTELRAAIEQLPEIEKQVIQLFYLSELSLREISQVLDIPVGTVKSRLARARSYLHEHLNGAASASQNRTEQA